MESQGYILLHLQSALLEPPYVEFGKCKAISAPLYVTLAIQAVEVKIIMESVH